MQFPRTFFIDTSKLEVNGKIKALKMNNANFSDIVIFVCPLTYSLSFTIQSFKFVFVLLTNSSSRKANPLVTD